MDKGSALNDTVFKGKHRIKGKRGCTISAFGIDQNDQGTKKTR